MRYARRFIVVVGVAALTGGASVAFADHIEGTSCGTTVTCASHEGWPRMTLDDVQRADKWRGTTLRGKPNNSDELLGWHGSDRLYGYDRSDVLWGDHVGTGQPSSQWDRMYGGPGDDFIYSSRGRNTIYGGSGNDAIKIRYGRGFLDCGAGRDVINVPRSRKHRWRIRNCEKVDYRTERQRGGGLKPLR
jgi:Ca2+-binding RTX toxin-like protein